LVEQKEGKKKKQVVTFHERTVQKVSSNEEKEFKGRTFYSSIRILWSSCSDSIVLMPVAEGASVDDAFNFLFFVLTHHLLR
jgi:hypothetical protein